MRILYLTLALFGVVRAGTLWPTESWPVSTPEEQGMDSARLEEARAFIEGNSSTRFSLLVVRNGRLVYERYFNRSSPSDANNIKSMSKSILSVLTGVALDEGLLTGTNQKLYGFFPEYFRGGDDPRKLDVTLAHVLTMTAGFEWGENTAISSRCFQSTDWHRAVIESPLTSAPGEVFNYSTGLTHLLSGILTRASGESTLSFASSRLFNPLGITCYRWSQDPRGYYFGGSEIWLTPRDLAKFGLLVLRNGQWEDRRIVSEEWLRTSTRLRVRPGGRSGSYGYLWWKHMLNGYSTTVASGYGGQNIFLVPELDLMMVTTARSDLVNQPDPVYADPYEIFARYVLPAVKAAPPEIPDGGVVHAAGYGARLAPGAFASVFGTNLSIATETWDASMPVDGRFPDGLGGVVLRIGGRVACPSFVSPRQVNFLVPRDLPPGRHRLELSTPQGRASQDVDVAELAPALFTFERNGTLLAAARSARPGERIELWASGLGATDPAAADGEVVTIHLPLVNKPEVLVGGRPAQVVYAALAFAGVYQLNIQIPEGLPPGPAPVQVRVGTVASQGEVALDIAP